MMETGFIRTVRREVRQIMSRRVVMFAMVFIPLFTTLFLTQVMRNGLPEHIPVAIVNLDDTEVTRALVRQIASSKEVRVVAEPRSDAEAMKLVREGKTYGYYVIPRNFTRDIMSGHQPQITYYTNSAYLVPGSLLFRNLKTNSVLASGAVVKNYLVSSGTMSDTQAQALLQPVKLQTNPLHNPQTNYGVYLLNSFLPTLLALIILTVTVFSICQETKLHTSPQWLASARGSMTMALLGKLLPYTLVFTAVGSLMQAYLFGYLHYPLACSAWQMVLTMLLYVMANQAFAVCSALREVSIGKKVKEIGRQAFYSDPSLVKVTVLKAVAPTIYSVGYPFDTDNTSLRIYVNGGVTLENYKTNSNWKIYSDKIFAIES